jgi:hypothetical protein
MIFVGLGLVALKIVTVLVMIFFYGNFAGAYHEYNSNLSAILPSLSTPAIQNIKSPNVGDLVYNNDYSILLTWNGHMWVPTSNALVYSQAMTGPGVKTYSINTSGLLFASYGGDSILFHTDSSSGVVNNQIIHKHSHTGGGRLLMDTFGPASNTLTAQYNGISSNFVVVKLTN